MLCPAFGRDLQGRGTFLCLGSLYLLREIVIASLAFFMPVRDAISNTIHTEFMEPRRVLLPLRTIAAPADCTCPLPGNGRNRHVSAALARTRTPGLAAQNCKSCLIGWPYIIWSCGSVPYGNGPHVCAASMGWVLQPAPGAAAVLIMRRRRYFGAAPFFDNKPIFIYARSTVREASNRQSGQHKHRITKGSNSTDGGTAVTNPLYSTTGGTELRLFPLLNLSFSRPTNRQVQSFQQITMRRSEVIRFVGYAARGALTHTSAPLSSTHQPLSIYEPPRRKGKATGLRGGFSPGPRTEAAPIFDTPSKNLYYHA